MSHKTIQLNELIEVTRDGERFYQHALSEVHDPALQTLFQDMIASKSRIIQTLAVEVATEYQAPAQGGTLLGKLRELYTDTRSALSRDGEATYVDQLAAAEQRILDAFEDALQDAEPDIKELLNAQMEQIRASNARMQQLKQARQTSGSQPH